MPQSLINAAPSVLFPGRWSQRRFFYRQTLHFALCFILSAGSRETLRVRFLAGVASSGAQEEAGLEGRSHVRCCSGPQLLVVDGFPPDLFRVSLLFRLC